MLAKILVGWFLLSVMVGLLLGRVISTFVEIPARDVNPPLENDLSRAALGEVKEEMRNLEHVQMEEVKR